MLIPIGDDQTHVRTFAPVTTLLILANVAVFVYAFVLGKDFTMGYGLIPMEVTRFQDIVGGMDFVIDGKHQQVYQAPGPSPIWLTVFTSMFLHGGFMHLAGNMLFLWIYGDNVEAHFGSVKFLFFYILCGIGAAAFQVISDFNSYIPMVGASGAISGVMGAYLIMFPMNKIRMAFLIFIQFNVPAFVVLGLWIVMQLQSGFGGVADSVAYMAHIGGFLVGAWWGWQHRKANRTSTLVMP